MLLPHVCACVHMPTHHLPPLCYPPTHLKPPPHQGAETVRTLRGRLRRAIHDLHTAFFPNPEEVSPGGRCCCCCCGSVPQVHSAPRCCSLPPCRVLGLRPAPSLLLQPFICSPSCNSPSLICRLLGLCQVPRLAPTVQQHVHHLCHAGGAAGRGWHIGRVAAAAWQGGSQGALLGCRVAVLASPWPSPPQVADGGNPNLRHIPAVLRPNPISQSLLQAVGVGAKRSLPAAATINWVLKDGLGRLGRLTVATRFGESFDSDLKRFRYTTSVIYAVSLRWAGRVGEVWLTGFKLLVKACVQHSGRCGFRAVECCRHTDAHISPPLLPFIQPGVPDAAGAAALPAHGQPGQCGQEHWCDWAVLEALCR